MQPVAGSNLLTTSRLPPPTDHLKPASPPSLRSTVAAELAIVATDLAEVIGSAVALNLLTGMPIWAGVLVTAADVLVLLAVGGKSLMFLEGIGERGWGFCIRD